MEHRHMTTTAEIEGRPFRIDECDWILWAPCRRPARSQPARFSRTETEAWASFCSTEGGVEEYRRAGYRVELVTYFTAKGRDVLGLLSDHPCPHLHIRVDACRHCPLPFRLTDGMPHAQRWAKAVGWHGWSAPSDEQIKARMLARRAARLAKGTAS
jgi:hypothetical protein